MDIHKEIRNSIEPDRIKYAQKQIIDLGYDVEVIGNEIQFYCRGHLVKFFPYTGWHTGKSIKDGRGLHNLLKQL